MSELSESALKGVGDVDIKSLVFNQITDEYLDNDTWRTKENSNTTTSIGGLILHQSGVVSANYWLTKIYNNAIAQAHKKADFHLHDLSILGAYCAGWNIRKVLEEGMGGVRNKIDSGPPKHLISAMQQLVNFLGVMQNEWAGAQAFSSFDTYLAPFIRIDNMTDKEIKQAVQQFLYGINVPSRWGSQAPFSNVTLDFTPPADIAEDHPIVAGKKQSFQYKDLQEEMDRFNKIFLEVFNEGDYSGNTFQYPIITINVTKDFRWEGDVAQKIFEATAKYGIPYFSNYVSSDMDPSEIRSMCCRLRLDLRELTRKNGSLFGSGENTGSVGVVTMNMPKLGYLSKTKEEFYERLDALMELAKESLEIKRKFITQMFDRNYYPYTKRYLPVGYENHFSTIGIVGMNECCLNFLGKDIKSKEGLKFVTEVLNHMREKCSDFQEETGSLFNLESTPAESTCYRLALHDLKKYPDIITAGTKQNPYYTNSSNLPVGETDDIWDAIKHQEQLQTLYTGGTVFHAYLNENIDDWEKARDFVKKVMYNSKLPYLTISPTFSHCQVHGYLKGDTGGVCPKCKEEQLVIYEKKLATLQEKYDSFPESDSCCG